MPDGDHQPLLRSVFKEGAFTSNDARVRALRAAEDDALDGPRRRARRQTYVFWGGREGLETNACKIAAATRSSASARRSTSSASTSIDQQIRPQVRPRGQAQRAARRHFPAHFGPHAGVHLHARSPRDGGAEPRGRRTSRCPASTSRTASGQALEAGKLFHIDLNGQKPGRYDQDLRFGSEDQKGAFFLVKLLEDAKWPGMRHFDSHAYRTEDEEGVWDFAYYSMRTYNILREKVARFHADPEISSILKSLREMSSNSVGEDRLELQIQREDRNRAQEPTTSTSPSSVRKGSLTSDSTS